MESLLVCIYGLELVSPLGEILLGGMHGRWTEVNRADTVRTESCGYCKSARLLHACYVNYEINLRYMVQLCRQSTYACLQQRDTSSVAL